MVVTLTGVLSLMAAALSAVPAMAGQQQQGGGDDSAMGGNGASSSASASASASASGAAGDDEPRGTPASDTGPTPSALPASTVSEPAADRGSGGTPRAASSQQQQQQQDGDGGDGSGSSSSSSSSAAGTAGAAPTPSEGGEVLGDVAGEVLGDVASERAEPEGDPSEVAGDVAGERATPDGGRSDERAGRGATASTLPFTGTGVLPIVILAAFMLTAGLLLRRATASSP